MEYARLDAAILFAAKRHSGQRRDGTWGLPYITHPIEVLTGLRHVGEITDETMLCAAVLHDLIEETKTKPSEIRTRFGEEVSRLVVELTRREPSSEETEGLNKDQVWSLRSGILLAEIAKMGSQAQAIKLADRLANVHDARHSKESTKYSRYLVQTREILEIIPREVNPALWNAIQAELRAPR